jgi:hypothetical protein
LPDDTNTYKTVGKEEFLWLDNPISPSEAKITHYIFSLSMKCVEDQLSSVLKCCQLLMWNALHSDQVSIVSTII